MNKRHFENLKGKYVKINLKPTGFGLVGVIDVLFDDCFQFTTNQQTSYIEYDCVMSIVIKEGRR